MARDILPTQPKEAGIEEREILLDDNLFKVPERLLLAHARGEVLFITGAGISMPALPDFRQLVIQVYEQIDPAAHEILNRIPIDARDDWPLDRAQLNDDQCAEIRRFVQKDYDVVLGMLERRIDPEGARTTRVRTAVVNVLHGQPTKYLPTHSALIRLAEREGITTIVTTNFDLLLENAARAQSKRLATYALGAIPRPSRSEDFAGVFHIHGALLNNREAYADLIVTDRDFGEFYLRRRIVPDFIYDAARLFHLVLVGYSANDAPMRYLLNAVAADSPRFAELKERFAFVGVEWPPDPVEKSDWKGRGITPIPYSSQNGHVLLPELLKRWADLSGNANQEHVSREIKRIASRARASASEADRDLFEHLFRRSGEQERIQIARLVSEGRASHDWLDVLLKITRERSIGKV
jgi:hypothetical protein